MSQQFPGVTSADVYMRSVRWPHISQIKEEGQRAISIDIVVKALTISHLLLGIGRTAKAPPHTSAHQHRLCTQILSSNGQQLRIGGERLQNRGSRESVEIFAEFKIAPR